MIRTLLLMCSCLAATTAVLAANDLEDGYQAYKKGDYQAAIEIWQQLAESGDATAQFNLAQMYRMGKGVRADDKLAAHWYLQAAQQGSRHAHHNLSMMYRDGRVSRMELDILAERQDRSPKLAVSSPRIKPQNDLETDFDESRLQSAKAKPSAQPTVTGPNSGADWRGRFADFDSDHYVAQLMASANKADVEHYIAAYANRLPEKRGYVRTHSKGREWYVLLLGPYASDSAANAAVDKLPAAIRKNKPWVRRVGHVKSILR